MTDQVNIPLLRKAVEWAESEAARGDNSLWWQGSWVSETSCGTSFCIAGFVGQALDERYADSETVDGVHVSDFAGDALGLPAAEPQNGCVGTGRYAFHSLFMSNNTIEDVRRIAEDLAGERL